MISENTNRESQRVAELATEYARKGYSVTLPQSADDTPQFLRELGYMPDLIARSKNETLVIEVKSRETSATLASLSNVADRVNAKPGWQFVLVFTNPRGTFVESQRSTPEKVARLLEKSRVMGYESQAHVEAAFLFAWSALEAALRSLPTHEITGRVASAPSTLIRNAAIDGLLARGDVRALQLLFKIRNSLLHAGDEVPPARSDVDRLLRITEEVLRQHRRGEV
jgi:hypothetical protein